MKWQLSSDNDWYYSPIITGDGSIVFVDFDGTMLSLKSVRTDASIN